MGLVTIVVKLLKTLQERLCWPHQTDKDRITSEAIAFMSKENHRRWSLFEKKLLVRTSSQQFPEHQYLKWSEAEIKTTLTVYT